MKWSEISSVVNLSWNLAAQFTMQIFGPLAKTFGCLFIVQGQPLQVVPFADFSYEISLSYPIYSRHIPSIPRTLIIGANS